MVLRTLLLLASYETKQLCSWATSEQSPLKKFVKTPIHSHWPINVTSLCHGVTAGARQFEATTEKVRATQRASDVGRVQNQCDRRGFGRKLLTSIPQRTTPKTQTIRPTFTRWPCETFCKSSSNAYSFVCKCRCSELWHAATHRQLLFLGWVSLRYWWRRRCHWVCASCVENARRCNAWRTVVTAVHQRSIRMLCAESPTKHRYSSFGALHFHTIPIITYHKFTQNPTTFSHNLMVINNRLPSYKNILSYCSNFFRIVGRKI